mgnify:CR=1 FL=1
MASVSEYIQGARPKTLSAAIVPVALGSSLSFWFLDNQDSSQLSRSGQSFSIPVMIGCLVVALFLQIGVNYANDYSDGVKGVDENRVGPMRLVGSGKASPKSVLYAMMMSFLVAAIAGIYVSSRSSWYFILLGAVCIALAWFYTGSKHPYGYHGFGELVAFICFGLVATVGTFYALVGEFAIESFYAGILTGLFSIAILLANNIRDIATDTQTGKKTLAVRIGEKNAKLAFKLTFLFVTISIFLLGMSIQHVWMALILLILALPIINKISKATEARQYIEILVATSKLNLLFGLVTSTLVIVNTL